MALTGIIIGSIDDNNGQRVFTVTKLSRHKAIYELNNWFFDYFKTNQIPIIQLPPLDDWVREGQNWSVHFSDQAFLVKLILNTDLE